MQSLGYIPGEPLTRIPRVIFAFLLLWFVLLRRCGVGRWGDLDDSKFTNPANGFRRPFFEFGSVSVVQLSKKRPEEYILYAFSTVSCEFCMLVLCLICWWWFSGSAFCFTFQFFQIDMQLRNRKPIQIGWITSRMSGDSFSKLASSCSHF